MSFPWKIAPIVRAAFCSLALMLFSFFIPFGFPLKIFAFISLLGAGILVSSQLKSWSDVEVITGKIRNPVSFALFMLAGIVIGIAVAVVYRWHLDTSLFPGVLFPFSLVALFIGSTEELVFRGFIQGQAGQAKAWFPVILGAVSHTGYKCCLFLSPANQVHIDIWFLAECTLAAGIILGIIRRMSGSVWPCVIAHALFDIMVYGENLNSPSWVW